METLLDTGALAGNFVLRQVVNDLNLQADIITKSCTSTVCSGLDNKCYDLTSTILLKLSYFCSIINKYASFEIQAFIIDNSPLKLIIGLQSIRKLNLFHIFPEYVGLNQTTTQSSTVLLTNSTMMCMPCCCQPEEDFATSKGSPKANQFTQTVPPAATQTCVIHASLIVESEQLLGQVSPDDDENDKH